MRVFDIRGLPVAGVAPEIRGRDPSGSQSEGCVALRTDGQGRADVALRPGRYEISLRSHRSTIDVPADGDVEAHVRYSGEAEVIVHGPFADMIVLRRVGSARQHIYNQGGRFLYVPAGEYEALLWENQRRPKRVLDVLSVAAGQRLEYDPDLPRGRIRVRITYRTDKGPAASAVGNIRVVPLQGGKPYYLGGNWGFVLVNREKRIGVITAELLGIAAGRYRVEFLGGNWEPVSTEVVVGDQTATAELNFKRVNR